ncbi:MAG: ATP-binding cassette domain-containing protein, partial [Chlamydiia bacterium]|nr:ATP-binding cassette domain-containing protein [Chlamydiia bacterium]
MFSSPPLISTHKLSKTFYVSQQKLVAVAGLDLDIYPGETLGLVGESGCGKSTVGRLLLRLQSPSSGHIFYRDRDLTLLSKDDLHPYRRQMQMIFQDPHASLNPRMTIQEALGEPLTIHRLAKGLAKKERIEELLSLVGLDADAMSRYPHEF